MKSNAKKYIAGIAIVALITLAVAGIGQKLRKSAAAKNAPVTFGSPAEAGAGLNEAAKRGDELALAKILGVDTETLLDTGDKEADTAAIKAFAAKYEKMNRWVDMNDSSRVLYIGADNFAFPIPLAKDSSGKWYFDAVAGAKEIRARNIGRNELLTIDACAALADAQEIYFVDGGSREFAQRIVSTQGKQDGLYWPASDEQRVSPLASLSELPKSSAASLSADKPLIIDGYELRILTAQGDDAPGGAMSYLVNGKMTGGFAVLATPLKYGETGIMTFMTSSDGIVYERDFGSDTAKIAGSIQEFNPTDDWSPVE